MGKVAYGFLRAAPGIGAAAMAVFLAFKPLQRRIGRGLLLAVFVFGASTVVLGLTHSYAMAFVALMILAGADMVSVYIRGSLVPLVTPDEKRGRVTAVENVFIGASNELGAFESGLMAQAVSLRFSIASGGFLAAGAAAIIAVFLPTMWRYDVRTSEHAIAQRVARQTSATTT